MPKEKLLLKLTMAKRYAIELVVTLNALQPEPICNKQQTNSEHMLTSQQLFEHISEITQFSISATGVDAKSARLKEPFE